MAKQTPNPADILAAITNDPELKGLLEALVSSGDPPRRATEMDTFIDPMERMEQFREQEFGPRASGVPYIFTGGSVFPQTEGQQRAEKTLAGGMFASNMLSSLNNVVPAIVDAWRKRKGQGGGNA